ncbi:MAG: hypothetical protein AAFN59_04825 [Pseudomonadota bacterium]
MREMVLALLIIGVSAGAFGAVVALSSGAGVLAAVAIYAGLGTCAVLLAACAVALAPDTPNEPNGRNIAIAAE